MASPVWRAGRESEKVSRQNMRTLFSLALAIAFGAVLSGCQSAHNSTDFGAAGPAFEPEAGKGSDSGGGFTMVPDPDVYWGETRHSNRATREFQYLPD